MTRAKSFSRGFAARVFGLWPKTCRPVADEAPRRTREKTSGTQGVWNSLIGRILILKRLRSFAAPSLVSLRVGVEVYAQSRYY